MYCIGWNIRVFVVWLLMSLTTPTTPLKMFFPPSAFFPFYPFSNKQLG